jgi:DNA excision repair protein ERCC-6
MTPPNNYFLWQERDKLIRKGVLTPFDQVKGFERRVQRSHPAKDNGDNFSINSI